MPLLRDYACNACGNHYEFMHHPTDTPAVCPHCASQDATGVMGGHLVTKFVPTYPGCKRVKAGYVHSHGDRPAEKISVSVPTKVGA
jgi:putative FmdB family regulatory protein